MASVPPQQRSGSSSFSSNLLAPSECLVYVENLLPFSDVDGYTYIARSIRDYIIDDTLWYDLLLETNSEGIRLPVPSPISVSGDSIVSDRSFHDISPRKMYHFAPLTYSSSVDLPEQARSFVIKSRIIKPLELTSRSALGSGIYGRYIMNENSVKSYTTNSEQAVYVIECPNAYPLQDKEHGESLTVASLTTNRYVDQIIQAFRSVINGNNNELMDPVENLNIARSIIKSNESPNLVTLWNFVFYRTQDSIIQEWLEELLAQYVSNYFSTTTLVDSLNGEPLQELPINDIMKGLGYDGIIASDIHNNRWNRGCVSYNYTSSTMIQGGEARY